MALLDAERRSRVVRFVAVGATGAAINSAVFYMLLRGGVDYRLAGFVAFFGSIQWNFVLNRRFTFGVSGGDVRRQWMVFNMVYSLGFLLYEAMLILLLGWLHVWWLAANLAAIVVGGTVNYLGAERVAFRVRSSLF